MTEYFTLPRLYTAADLNQGAAIALDDKQTHYLKNVLRKNPGDQVRLFNGRDGEWLCDLKELGKKSGIAMPVKKLREQKTALGEVHLIFAPIKKNRMDVMIEKAVELEVTHLHPVLTNRTEVREINEKRLRAQLIEASEQSERLDIPTLLPLTTLAQKIKTWNSTIPLYWCLERAGAPHLATIREQNWAFIIGPVGGFDQKEIDTLSTLPPVRSVSLGEPVYRVETAAFLCLAHALFSRSQ